MSERCENCLGHFDSGDEGTVCLCAECSAVGEVGTARDKTESAWLVELAGSPPRWWTGEGFSDANSALRFSRREDAEQAIRVAVPRSLARRCVATEHQWVAQ